MNSLPSSVERENLGQILLENLQEITDKLDKIVTDSDRIILDNLLQETKILLDRVKYNSKTYQARADIFGQINQLWLQVCKQYRDEDSALELIRIGKARNNHNAKPKRFCCFPCSRNATSRFFIDPLTNASVNVNHPIA
jgi:hypothetical protein